MIAPYQERAVLFGRGRNLVGVLCRPTAPSHQPVVVFINSGIIHRIGATRIYVILARALAERGFTSLRFDLAGVGDSVVPRVGPPHSLEEQTAVDLDDALQHLSEDLGADRFITAGLCSGADNALRTMARDPRVVGTILLDLNAHRTVGYYLRYYGRRLLRLRSWLNVVTGRHPAVQVVLRRASGGTAEAEDVEEAVASGVMLPRTILSPEELRDHLARIVERRGKILAIFTAGLPNQYNYRRQFLDLVPGFDFQDCLQLEYYGDSDHVFTRRHIRERLQATVLDWAHDAEFPPAPRPDHSAPA